MSLGPVFRKAYKWAVPNGFGPVDVGWLLTIGFLLLIEWLALQPVSGDDAFQYKYQEFLTLRTSEMGDTLAGVFAALAFIWIIVTVFLQSHELSEQREVLKQQQMEFKEQNANLRQQTFENTFFQMLSTLSEIVEAIDLVDRKGNPVTTKGRDCFKVFYERLERSYNNFAGKTLSFEEVNQNFFDELAHELGHYFRFLYNFFKFLDNSPLQNHARSKLLRAFLSDYELLLLYYNCKTANGKNFTIYTEKYELFENLRVQRLLEPKHLEFYPEKCFGDSVEYVAAMETLRE